jgi:hypothetical protein
VALATFLQLLRPQTLEEQRALRTYRTEVQQVANRMRATFDSWIHTREIEPDHARLANAAAVSRWELMRLAQQIEALDPPRSLANVQREVYNAVTGCARACQLLANGYRFHKSEAVCDGQMLLIQTVKSINDLAEHLQTRA